MGITNPFKLVQRGRKGRETGEVYGVYSASLPARTRQGGFRCTDIEAEGYGA